MRIHKKRKNRKLQFSFSSPVVVSHKFFAFALLCAGVKAKGWRTQQKLSSPSLSAAFHFDTEIFPSWIKISRRLLTWDLLRSFDGASFAVIFVRKATAERKEERVHNGRRSIVCRARYISAVWSHLNKKNAPDEWKLFTTFVFSVLFACCSCNFISLGKLVDGKISFSFSNVA